MHDELCDKQASSLAKSAEKKKEPFIALLAYVDDCCITGDCPELIDALVARIKRDCNDKLDDMGELKHFLGMEIRRCCVRIYRGLQSLYPSGLPPLYLLHEDLWARGGFLRRGPLLGP